MPFTPEYDTINDFLDYVNLPYDNDDTHFQPLTDQYCINEWNSWLQYTANTIGVSLDELLAQNFTTLHDLLVWCSTGSRYTTAYDKYNQQYSKYSYKWAFYIKEHYPQETNNYTVDTICIKLEEWVEDMFQRFFIWALDTHSIIEATTDDDVSIFDTSPMESFFCSYLISADQDQDQDQDQDDDDDD